MTPCHNWRSRGCPQAPLLAKTFLQPILTQFQSANPDFHLNGWVDDIGFDGSHHDAQHLAQRTLQAWQQLRDGLQAVGLVVNSHKTAFIVTDKTIHKELAKLLSPTDPPIQTVMRDLGIDHSAARRRRIGTLQQSFRKNRQRRVKLRSLKLPKPPRQTTAPQRWSPTSGILEFQRTRSGAQILAGTPPVPCRPFQQQVCRPREVVIQHIKALPTLVTHWPADHRQHIEQAWITLRNQLRKHKYHLAYLREWGWTRANLYQWQRHETAFMTEAHINLADDWDVVENTLHQEAQQQRTNRFKTARTWSVGWIGQRRAKPASRSQHLRTWNQAAIHYRQGDKVKTCPLRNVPATPKHIVWHHNQGHEPLPIAWRERLQDPLEETLWAHGWISKEPQDHLQTTSIGQGCWNTLEPLPLQPWQGLAVTLDATPSSYDQRSQAWVSACAHTDQRDHPAGHGLGGVEQPTETKRV